MGRGQESTAVLVAAIQGLHRDGFCSLVEESVLYYQGSEAPLEVLSVWVDISVKTFIYLFIFLAALGLRCCAWAFSRCGERGLLFVAVRGLLIAVASLVGEHRI